MTEFAGDKKKGTSLLGKVERRFIDWGIPKVPKPIMSHHLTYVTIFWSAGTILFGAILVMTGLGIANIERKKRIEHGFDWQRFDDSAARRCRGDEVSADAGLGRSAQNE